MMVYNGSDKPGITGRIRARPIRVAYFLDLRVDEVHPFIDTVRDHSLGIWAGRYSPIIPIEDGGVSEKYWNWLERYDPDLIYSFVHLTSALRVKIITDIDPAELIEPTQSSDQIRSLRHAFRTNQLSSLSILQNLPRSQIAGTPPVRLFNSWTNDFQDTSLHDNFGDSHKTFNRFPLPTEDLGIAEVVTLIDKAKLQNSRFMRKPEGIIVHSEEEAWRHMLENPMIGLPQITALNTPRFEHREREISHYLQLVIGNTASDRILYWNIGHFFPSWREGAITCLRITKEELESDEIVRAIKCYAETHNRISQNANHTGNVAIRSTSLEDMELNLAADRFKADKPRAYYRVYDPHDHEEIVPSADELEHLQFDLPNMGIQLSRWEQFYWDGKLALPPYSYPEHLVKASGTEKFDTGNWAVDVDLSRADDYSKYENVRHTWRFSRRLRMVNAIRISKKTADIFGRYPSEARRVSQNGLLTTFSSVDHPVSEISMPADTDLFRHALTKDGIFVSSQKDFPVFRAPFDWMKRSDKGDYLRGLIGFAGGLDAAFNFLLHGFWAAQLDKWGASSKVSPEAMKMVLKRLQKTIKKSKKPPSDHLEEIAKTAVRYSRTYRTPWQTIQFRTLDNEWTKFRTAFWKQARVNGNVVGEQTDAEKKEWEQREQDTLKSAISELVSEEVLFQGVTLPCTSCRHRNWVSISDFSHDLICDVCQEVISVPLQLDWEFKLNDFFLKCVRDHGIHSVVWALNICREISQFSFYFLEPTDVWLGRSDETGPTTDLDITAIIDGRSYVIEVKSSASNFGVDARSEFAHTIELISPDHAVVAIMEDLTDRQRSTIIKQAEKLLSGVNTEFELWSLDQYPLKDDPYL